MQRSAVDAHQVSDVPPIVHKVLRSPGQPLDGATRSFMEPRFGHDFSQVKVHTDSKAAESAQAVNARAYTVGYDVVFDAGQYAPYTNAGRRLLAHELTHTVQQGAGTIAGAHIAGALRIGAPWDAYEQEAEAQAANITTESPARPTQMINRASLQRQGDPSQIPPGMACPPATTSAAGVVTNNLLFGTAVATLSPTQKTQIAAFVANWQALGANTDVRVDGFASLDGPQGLNWQLSCDRAEAVRGELINPSAASANSSVMGIPPGRIEVFANGETSEFGSLADLNRHATITTLTPLPSSPPTPVRQRDTRVVSDPLCRVLQREQQVGTWQTILEFNAITGHPPGRNVIVPRSNGPDFDLTWALDVGWVTGEIGGDCSSMVGAVFGRLGEYVCAGLGLSAGGLSYPFARVIGAVVTAYTEGKRAGWRYLTSGTVNPENLSGADVGLKIGASGAVGGEARQLRDYVQQSAVNQCAIPSTSTPSPAPSGLSPRQ